MLFFRRKKRLTRSCGALFRAFKMVCFSRHLHYCLHNEIYIIYMHKNFAWKIPRKHLRSHEKWVIVIVTVNRSDEA